MYTWITVTVLVYIRILGQVLLSYIRMHACMLTLCMLYNIFTLVTYTIVAIQLNQLRCNHQIT